MRATIRKDFNVKLPKPSFFIVNDDEERSDFMTLSQALRVTEILKLCKVDVVDETAIMLRESSFHEE